MELPIAFRQLAICYWPFRPPSIPFGIEWSLSFVLSVLTPPCPNLKTGLSQLHFEMELFQVHGTYAPCCIDALVSRGDFSRRNTMGLILLLVILVLLFGGGGFYMGPPFHYYGGGVGTILVIVIIVLLLRG
jgi:hypothetical protein